MQNKHFKPFEYISTTNIILNKINAAIHRINIIIDNNEIICHSIYYQLKTLSQITNAFVILLLFPIITNR